MSSFFKAVKKSNFNANQYKIVDCDSFSRVLHGDYVDIHTCVYIHISTRVSVHTGGQPCRKKLEKLVKHKLHQVLISMNANKNKSKQVPYGSLLSNVSMNQVYIQASPVNNCCKSVTEGLAFEVSLSVQMRAQKSSTYIC